MLRNSIKSSIIVLVLTIFTFISLPAQDLQTAISYYKSEQFAASSSLFKKLLAASPDNGDLYYYYGVSFIRKYQSDTMNISFLEMADSSKSVFELGAAKDPKDPLNFVGLGGISLFSHDLSKAQAYYAKAISLLPSKANKTIVMSPEKQATTYLFMAEFYIRSGNFDTAQVFSLLRKAEQLNKKDPLLYIVKGDAYIFMFNDGSKAITNYNIAQSLDPKSPEAKLRVGQLWMRARNYPDALSTYKEVVNIDPNFAPAYRELGYLYSRANRNDDAQANYKKFLDLSANNTTARKQYVNTLIDLKKYAEAITELESVIKVDTMDNDVNRALAYCYFETGQYEKGLVYSKKFFSKANPDKVRATDYAYLGRLLAKTKQDSLAQEQLMKAYKMDTSRSELLSDAAMSLIRQKKYDKAVSVFQMKIDMNDATPNDYYNLGKVYYNMKNWSMADSTLAYYSTLNPEHLAGYLWRARVLVNIDTTFKLGLAKPVYEVFIEKAKTDSVKNARDLMEAYSYMGYVNLVQFKETKDQQYGIKSAEYYNKVLAIQPPDPNFTDKAKAILKDLEPKLKK
jgi:tetratricopeptide (TPR) repeat protein